MTEASGSSTSEHVEERGEREKKRECSKAVLFILSGTSLDAPTAAVPIRLFPAPHGFFCHAHVI